LSRSSSQGSATRPFSRASDAGVGYSRSSHLGCTPHTDVSADALRPLSDLAGPPVQPYPCGSGQMQPSYWFHGATATPWCSMPITSTTCFHKPWGHGVRVRVWTFGRDIRLSRLPEDRGVPRPDIPFTCTQAFERALSHTCALLLPFSFAC